MNCQVTDIEKHLYNIPTKNSKTMISDAKGFHDNKNTLTIKTKIHLNTVFSLYAIEDKSEEFQAKS